MFTVSCESTIDLPREYIDGRNCPTIKYSYFFDGEEHVDDMDTSAEHMEKFYAVLKAKRPTTSLICQAAYEEYFEELMQKGDVLHIAFGSGMSQSVANAFLAQKVISAKYPDRKLYVVDSTCSSAGYGLLVDDALDKRDAGESIDQIYAWLKANVRRVHHQFFSTDLSYFKRSGRVSGSAALFGTLFGICPVMRLNYDGKIIAYSKTLGKKKALKHTLEEVRRHIENGENYDKKIFISHSDCLETAQTIRDMLAEAFPKASIRIVNIGPIIACHCGPGTTAVFFWGDERMA